MATASVAMPPTVDLLSNGSEATTTAMPARRDEPRNLAVQAVLSFTR